MSLRATQKQMTRARLLESGLKMFREKGYAAATIDDIAMGVGANRTTFYLHFSSKEQLMAALIDRINDEVVASDKPRLTQIAESGDRDQIQNWLARRFDQWPEIMPYVSVAQQAAAIAPDIAAAVERWLETPITEIQQGLDAANRFTPASRRMRGVLAFGEVEFLSRRWVLEGWGPALDRDEALELLTDSWCHLLCDND